MGYNKETSALIDGLLRTALVGSVVGVALVAPNAFQALDAPLNKFLGKLDTRDKERKLKLAILYMKRRGLVTGDYDHGITITKSGKKRLSERKIEDLVIARPKKWDGKWRLVFFDIPETDRSARIALTRTLSDLGYQILQRSIWVYPHESRDVIARVCEIYGVSEWLTYVATDHIDHQDKLIKRFINII